MSNGDKGSDISITSFIIQHVSEVSKVSLLKFFKTNDTMYDTIMLGFVSGIIALTITRLLQVIKEPAIWYQLLEQIGPVANYIDNFTCILQKILTFGQMQPRRLFNGWNFQRDPFTFLATEAPFPAIRHSVQFYDKSKQLLEWLLRNTANNIVATAVHSYSPNITEIYETGTQSKFASIVDVSASGNANWIAFMRASNGKFIYYMAQGNAGNFNVTIGSENFKALDEALAYIVKMGIIPPRPTQTNSASLSIARVKPENSTTIGYVNPKRTFDCLFFEKKDDYIRLLNSFRDNKMYPAHVGSDNKMGVLLYGPPGTGKTHAIVATANYLKKKIISIQMRDVKTCTDFDKVLEAAKGDNIFVLEEIDCVLDILRKREGESDYEENEGYGTDYEQTFNIYVNTKDKDQKAKLLEDLNQIRTKNHNRLNLGYILEKLDGITDESGRLIIATTNHHEMLDPALLRPGRLGFHLELGRCTRTMIVDILTYYYQLSEDKIEEIKKIEFPENVYAPAELIQTIQMKASIDDVIATILKPKSVNSAMKSMVVEVSRKTTIVPFATPLKEDSESSSDSEKDDNSESPKFKLNTINMKKTKKDKKLKRSLKSTHTGDPMIK